MDDLVTLKSDAERRKDIEREIAQCLQMERQIHSEAVAKIMELQKKRESLYREWKSLGGKVE